MSVRLFVSMCVCVKESKGTNHTNFAFPMHGA